MLETLNKEQAERRLYLYALMVTDFARFAKEFQQAANEASGVLSDIDDRGQPALLETGTYKARTRRIYAYRKCERTGKKKPVYDHALVGDFSSARGKDTRNTLNSRPVPLWYTKGDRQLLGAITAIHGVIGNAVSSKYLSHVIEYATKPMMKKYEYAEIYGISYTNFCKSYTRAIQAVISSNRRSFQEVDARDAG